MEATTAFLAGEINCEAASDILRLTQELETLLKTFGGYLFPYAKEREASADLYHQLEQNTAACSIGCAFFSLKGSIVLTERYTFPSLRDVLYMELGRAILHGSAPRQCRLCGGWFFRKQGDRAIYCERTAPGETEKTCREIGARAAFEKKLQNKDSWKLYKRAYKKYYARYMKGNMVQLGHGGDDIVQVLLGQAAAFDGESGHVGQPCPLLQGLQIVFLGKVAQR